MASAGSDAEGTPPARGDDDQQCDKFEIRAQAFILTYQRRLYEDQFTRLPVFVGVREYSWSTEMARHEHTHMFVVMEDKPQALTVKEFTIDGLAPHCSPSSTRGRSARRGWDRGHFYCFVPYKVSHVDSGGNYRPVRDYAVETSWITTLWRQGKLESVIECAAAYRCLTPYLETCVARTLDTVRDSKRRTILRQRQRVLDCQQQEFRSIPAVNEWAEQFESVRYRYKFLWFSGPSGVGKTMYAKSLGEEVWLHSSGVNWTGYNPLANDLIIFDDIYDMEEYINKNKPIFQSARSTTVNTSKTNCYALTVDTAGIKIVICSNDPPRGRWILSNCIHHEVTERMWVDHHALTDVQDPE